MNTVETEKQISNDEGKELDRIFEIVLNEKETSLFDALVKDIDDYLMAVDGIAQFEGIEGVIQPPYLKYMDKPLLEYMDEPQHYVSNDMAAIRKSYSSFEKSRASIEETSVELNKMRETRDRLLKSIDIDLQREIDVAETFDELKAVFDYVRDNVQDNHLRQYIFNNERRAKVTESRKRAEKDASPEIIEKEVNAIMEMPTLVEEKKAESIEAVAEPSTVLEQPDLSGDKPAETVESEMVITEAPVDVKPEDKPIELEAANDSPTPLGEAPEIPQEEPKNLGKMTAEVVYVNGREVEKKDVDVPLALEKVVAPNSADPTKELIKAAGAYEARQRGAMEEGIETIKARIKGESSGGSAGPSIGYGAEEASPALEDAAFAPFADEMKEISAEAQSEADPLSEADTPKVVAPLAQMAESSSSVPIAVNIEKDLPKSDIFAGSDNAVETPAMTAEPTEKSDSTALGAMSVETSSEPVLNISEPPIKQEKPAESTVETMAAAEPEVDRAEVAAQSEPVKADGVVIDIRKKMLEGDATPSQSGLEKFLDRVFGRADHYLEAKKLQEQHYRNAGAVEENQESEKAA